MTRHGFSSHAVHAAIMSALDIIERDLIAQHPTVTHDFVRLLSARGVDLDAEQARELCHAALGHATRQAKGIES